MGILKMECPKCGKVMKVDPCSPVAMCNDCGTLYRIKIEVTLEETCIE